MVFSMGFRWVLMAFIMCFSMGFVWRGAAGYASPHQPLSATWRPAGWEPPAGARKRPRGVQARLYKPRPSEKKRKTLEIQ